MPTQRGLKRLESAQDGRECLLNEESKQNKAIPVCPREKGDARVFVFVRAFDFSPRSVLPHELFLERILCSENI